MRLVKRWIDYLPVASTVLLEWANVSQLIRMWTEHTAAGQSVLAWISVCLALVLFLIYYRAKGLTVPFWTTVFGVGMNSAVWMTVIYFRYLT